MNKRLYWLLTTLLLMAVTVNAQVEYVTDRPRVDDVNDPLIKIRRIELTDKYTIIYMTFLEGEEIPGLKLPPELSNTPRTINFQPGARLYADQGARSFKFIKAENIPTARSRSVVEGERVDFAVYFERLAPGITTFDLFECSDRRLANTICFNFWGVHVINPRKKPPVNKPKPATPAPAKPPVQARPAPVTPPPADTVVAAPILALKGTVLDQKTRKPVTANISYRLISGAESTGGVADSVRSQPGSGQFSINAEALSVYAVTVSAKGYFGQTDTVTVLKSDKVHDVSLVPIEAGAKITLKNIYFNASKYDLKTESFPELDRLLKVMRENPGMSIRLEGHTDILGDFDANVELSRNRVNEVKRYLIQKGIAADRIETVGYGPSRPINTNKSLKERPENRRVEMVVIKA